MADKRSLPSQDRHVHMNHVREHLQRMTRHAAAIHGRDGAPLPETHSSPARSTPPSSPRSLPVGGGGASS